MSVRTLPVFTSLHRYQLFLGAERNLSMPVLIVSGMLILNGQTLVSCLTGLVLWFCSMLLFRKLATIDPQMSVVFSRHARQAGFYPARTSPWRMG